MSTPTNLADVFGPYLERPRSFITPVIASRNNSVELIGSSVLIKIDHETYLLTAAHVTDFNETHELMIPGKDSLIHLSGYLADIKLPSSGRRADDRYDIAYYKLDHDVVLHLHPDFSTVVPEDVDLMDVAAESDAYSLIGYPATKSEAGQGKISGDLFTLSGDGTNQSIYTKLGLRPEQHLIVRYRRKKGVNYSTGQRALSPLPHGMSGGGVFAWNKKLPDIAALANPKLVAILTEYHPEHNVFVATRLHCYLHCIAKNNPSAPIFPA